MSPAAQLISNEQAEREAAARRDPAYNKCVWCGAPFTCFVLTIGPMCDSCQIDQAFREKEKHARPTE